LRGAGVQVRHPGADVPFGSPDEAWLRTAGDNRWIVLMRDQRVRNRPLELDALREARVGAFVLTAGQASAQETVDAVIGKLRKMANIAVSEPKPFVYALSAGGVMSRLKLRRLRMKP
jgi:hypothetical protein